jgi:hypothetical protein
MHYEKKRCENILKTIFGIKNTMAIWKDLKECRIWTHLWLQTIASGLIKLTTSYVSRDWDKEIFLDILLHFKTPTHYVSSLKKKLHKDWDLKGMKSHDFHVMMQDILLLCLWGLMSKGCRMSIIRLCHVFKKLCVKIVDPTTMGELKKEVAICLVLL